MNKIFIIDQNKLEFNTNAGWTLIGIPEKPDRTLSDHEYFSFMMIYLIEFNQIIRILISCGSLYKMNQTKINIILKQQRYTMTRSKIRRGVLPNIKPSILFR